MDSMWTLGIRRLPFKLEKQNVISAAASINFGRAVSPGTKLPEGWDVSCWGIEVYGGALRRAASRMMRGFAETILTSRTVRLKARERERD